MIYDVRMRGFRMYHTTKFIRLNKILIFICNIVLIMVFILLAKPIKNIILASEILKESSYNYLGNISISNDPIKNSYYANIGYISFWSKEDTYIICDNLMTQEKAYYDGNYFTKYQGEDIGNSNLSSGECAISSNLSVAYKIQINDCIKVRINFKDYIITVKYIFEPYYGLKEVDIFNDIGLIILGYDSSILKNAVIYDIVQFAEESIFFTDSDISVKDRLIFDLRIQFYILCTLFAVIVSLIYFIVECLFSDDIHKDVFALRYIGLSKIKIIKYNLLDAFYKYLALYIIPVIVLIIYSLLKEINCAYELVIILLCFIITIGCSVIKTQIRLRRQ